ncbi:hypothetical protein KKE75_04925 [Patescibacteria group bacterium]|nr:hypothetical protein [Patescibacteria group bacterium]
MSKIATVFQNILGQAIDEWTGTAVTKLVNTMPVETLAIIKKIGIDKLLPVFSVAITSAFPNLGNTTKDLVREFTSELRQAMNVRLEGGTTGSTTGMKLNNLLLSPSVASIFSNLLTGFAELFQDEQGNERPEQEKKAIMVMIAELGQQCPERFYALLLIPQDQKQLYLSQFIKKAKEESFEEAMKKLKDELKKAYQVVFQEILKPAWDKAGKPAYDFCEQQVNAGLDVAENFIQKGEDYVAQQRSRPLWKRILF